MKIAFSNDGTITISPSDSIDEYALERWCKQNEFECDKIIIETRMSTTMGFKKKVDDTEIPTGNPHFTR